MLYYISYEIKMLVVNCA